MTEPKNPFEAMMAMTQDMAKAFNPALESFTPKGFEALWPTMPKEMMETVMGKTFNPEGLDAKTKLLLTLGALTILGAQAEAQIRLTVRHALEAGQFVVWLQPQVCVRDGRIWAEAHAGVDDLRSGGHGPLERVDVPARLGGSVR